MRAAVLSLSRDSILLFHRDSTRIVLILISVNVCSRFFLPFVRTSRFKHVRAL